MSKQGKLILKILEGSHDQAITFNELRNLLKRVGFEERIRGSHHNFRKPGIQDKINIQPVGHYAKPYQVRQVR